MLEVTHGATISDYYRCKKLNPTACPECKKTAAEYVRARRAADRDKDRLQRKDQRLRNPESRRESEKRYRQKYPEKQRIKGRKKRARKHQAITASYTYRDVLDLWGTDCHICTLPIDMRITRHCGEEGWENGLHLDHVIPLSKNGPDIISNVKPSHAKCNISKSARLLYELATS